MSQDKSENPPQSFFDPVKEALYDIAPSNVESCAEYLWQFIVQAKEIGMNEIYLTKQIVKLVIGQVVLDPHPQHIEHVAMMISMVAQKVDFHEFFKYMSYRFPFELDVTDAEIELLEYHLDKGRPCAAEVRRITRIIDRSRKYKIQRNTALVLFLGHLYCYATVRSFAVLDILNRLIDSNTEENIAVVCTLLEVVSFALDSEMSTKFNSGQTCRNSPPLLEDILLWNAVFTKIGVITNSKEFSEGVRSDLKKFYRLPFLLNGPPLVPNVPPRSPVFWNETTLPAIASSTAAAVPAGSPTLWNQFNLANPTSIFPARSLNPTSIFSARSPNPTSIVPVPARSPIPRNLTSTRIAPTRARSPILSNQPLLVNVTGTVPARNLFLSSKPTSTLTNLTSITRTPIRSKESTITILANTAPSRIPIHSKESTISIDFVPINDVIKTQKNPTRTTTAISTLKKPRITYGRFDLYNYNTGNSDYPSILGEVVLEPWFQSIYKTRFGKKPPNFSKPSLHVMAPRGNKTTLPVPANPTTTHELDNENIFENKSQTATANLSNIVPARSSKDNDDDIEIIKEIGPTFTKRKEEEPEIEFLMKICASTSKTSKPSAKGPQIPARCSLSPVVTVPEVRSNPPPRAQDSLIPARCSLNPTVTVTEVRSRSNPPPPVQDSQIPTRKSLNPVATVKEVRSNPPPPVQDSLMPAKCSLSPVTDEDLKRIYAGLNFENVGRFVDVFFQSILRGQNILLYFLMRTIECNVEYLRAFVKLITSPSDSKMMPFLDKKDLEIYSMNLKRFLLQEWNGMFDKYVDRKAIMRGGASEKERLIFIRTTSALYNEGLLDSTQIIRCLDVFKKDFGNPKMHLLLYHLLNSSGFKLWEGLYTGAEVSVPLSYMENLYASLDDLTSGSIERSRLAKHLYNKIRFMLMAQLDLQLDVRKRIIQAEPMLDEVGNSDRLAIECRGDSEPSTIGNNVCENGTIEDESKLFFGAVVRRHNILPDNIMRANGSMEYLNNFMNVINHPFKARLYSAEQLEIYSMNLKKFIQAECDSLLDLLIAENDEKLTKNLDSLSEKAADGCFFKTVGKFFNSGFLSIGFMSRCLNTLKGIQTTSSYTTLCQLLDTVRTQLEREVRYGNGFGPVSLNYVDDLLRFLKDCLNDEHTETPRFTPEVYRLLRSTTGIRDQIESPPKVPASSLPRKEIPRPRQPSLKRGKMSKFQKMMRAGIEQYYSGEIENSLPNNIQKSDPDFNENEASSPKKMRLSLPSSECGHLRSF